VLLCLVLELGNGELCLSSCTLHLSDTSEKTNNRGMEEEEQIDGREKEEGEKRIEGGCLRGFDL